MIPPFHNLQTLCLLALRPKYCYTVRKTLRIFVRPTERIGIHMNATNTSPEYQQLRKELKRTRLFCLVSSLLTACLLVGSIFLSFQLRKLTDFVEETAPQLDKLIVFTEEIKPTLDNVSDFLEDAAPALDEISEIDIDSLNGTLNGLKDLDMEALTKSLKALNGIVDNLNSVSERLGSVFSIFSNN